MKGTTDCQRTIFFAIHTPPSAYVSNVPLGTSVPFALSQSRDEYARLLHYTLRRVTTEWWNSTLRVSSHIVHDHVMHYPV